MANEPPTYYLPLDIAGEYDVEELIANTPSTASSGQSRFSFVNIEGGDRELTNLGGTTISEGVDDDQDTYTVPDVNWPFIGDPNDYYVSDDGWSDDDPPSPDDSSSSDSSSSSSNSSSSMVADTWDATNLAANGEGKPRVGGIMLEEGKLIPFVGKHIGSTILHFSFNNVSGPDTDGRYAESHGQWIAVNKEDGITYTCKMKGPEFPTQLRPTDMKGARKIQDIAQSYDGTKYNGLEKDADGVIVPIHRLLKEIELHMKRFGMLHVFTDVNLDGERTVNLFTQYNTIDLDEIKTCIDEFLGQDTTDSYDRQALDWSGDYIRNRCTTALMERVETNISPGASGPVVLIAVLQQVMEYTYRALQNLKEKIKQKTIKEFAAESVTLYVEWLKDVLAPIVGAAALEPELLTDICKHIEDCGEERMRKKATEWYDKCEKYATKARLKGGYSLVASADAVDWETMLQSLKDHHSKLVKEGRYGPAVDHKAANAEPGMPQIMAAVTNLTKTVKQISFDDRRGGGGGNSSGSGGGRQGGGSGGSGGSGGGNNRYANVQCHKCKKYGHIKANCPDKDTSSGDGNNEQQNQPSLPTGWRFIPANKWTHGNTFPIENGKLKTGKGKPMPWCSKCPGKNAEAPKGRWTGHTTCDHDESKVRKGRKKAGDGASNESTETPTHAAAAAAGQTELDEEQLRYLQPDM